MKISNEEVSRLLATTPQTRAAARANAASSVQADSDLSLASLAAHVKISTDARDINLAKRAVEQVPDVRADRVAALKAQVENGTYKVSSEDIADLIIRRTLADNTSL